MSVIYILFCLFLFVRQSTPTCFRGTTSGCQFQCHCADDKECISESSQNDGGCSSGCKSIDAVPGLTIGDMWSGPGCQVGNIANYSQIDCYGCYYKDGIDDISFLVDSSVDDKGCLNLKESRHLNIRFDFQTVIYNISFIYRESLPHRISIYTSPNDIDLERSDSNDDTLIYEASRHFPVDRLDIDIRRGLDGFTLCELIVIGYQYMECEPVNDNFFFGPGCLLKCNQNCAVQCDVISGHCSLCTNTSTGSECENCISGYYGEVCNKVCHCKNESCLDKSGECPLTGCAEGYIGTSCDRVLPNLNDTTPTVEYNRPDIIISLKEIDHINLNTSFMIEYRATGMEWKQNGPKYNKQEIQTGGLFSSSGNNNFYYVRIIPFDLQYNIFGEASNYVHIYVFNEKTSFTERNTNTETTRLSQTVWIILIFVTLLFTFIVTSSICFCKQKYTKSQESNAECENEKDNSSELYANYDCSKNETQPKPSDIPEQRKSNEYNKEEDEIPGHYTPLHTYANLTEEKKGEIHGVLPDDR